MNIRITNTSDGAEENYSSWEEYMDGANNDYNREVKEAIMNLQRITDDQKMTFVCEDGSTFTYEFTD